MQATSNDVRVESARDGAMMRLIVDKPKGNIFTATVMNALNKSVTRAAQNTTVKLITIEGAGAHFSYGASIEEHTRDRIGDVLAPLRWLVMSIASSPVPVAALVQGCCFGGAFEAVLATHYVFATPDSRMSLPEIKLAVFPPAACALLPHRVSQSYADRMVIGGEELSGEQLKAAGLVHSTFPADSLFEGAAKWFDATLAPLSASSLRIATLASRKDMLSHLEHRLIAQERCYLDHLMPTHDANEGIAAFIEKRKPVWSNQ